MEKYDETFANKIAKACIKKYLSLGKNGKPQKGECAFLACILKEEVLGVGPGYNIEVVALGTGSKCIGESQESLDGSVLRDSHAEVIASRTFKRYLLDQVELAIDGRDSIFTIGKEGCSLKDPVKFHFYCSHTPCGDASILPKKDLPKHASECDSKNTSSNKDDPCSVNKKIKLDKDILNDSTFGSSLPASAKNNDDIYRTGAKCAPGENSDSKEAGLNYHTVGSLRVKPGRGDPSLSHSCSDKMFKWTVLGIQGALLMLFLSHPIYLETLTVGSEIFNYNSLHRAMYSRFKEKLGKMMSVFPFKVATPKLLHSDIPFEHWRSDIRFEPSHPTLIWSKSIFHRSKHEVSVEGKRLGTTKKTANSLKSQVSICRNQLLFKVSLLMKNVVSNYKKLPSIDAKQNTEIALNSLKSVSVEKEATQSAYEDMFKKIVKLILADDDAEFDICSTFEKKLFNKTYREMKDLAVNYQLMWKTLKEEVLVNWTKKNEDSKCFKARG